MNKKNLLEVLGVLCVSLLINACSSDSPSSTMPNSDAAADNDNADTIQAPRQGVKQRFPVDGQIDFSALNKMTVTLDYFDAEGNSIKATQVDWAMLSDDLNLYLAFAWHDSTFNNDFDHIGPVNFDGIKLLFDIDGDGLYQDGEDARTLIAALSGSLYIDQHKAGGDETDMIANGRGKLRYNSDSNTYSAEFLIPLVDDAVSQDGVITANTLFNFLLYDDVRIKPEFSGYEARYQAVDETTQWIVVDLDDDADYAHPELPSDLDGLIVFVSTHEVDNGEIYALQAASGEIKQITDMPGLFKDNISLSHDRSRIAFHGANNKNDYSAYEIYTINIDGSGLTQLSHNNILDGHPGWSPDDRMIVYTSFRGANAEENIILMSDTGVELVNLTPIGNNDNDPDFLPNGDIVFKTDRFSDAPETRIAVMDVNGANVRQLTIGNNRSDHDPVGWGTRVLFERFNKGTYYATDEEALFTPWDIIEMNTETLQEKSLVADAWVNWLPVYSPSGDYIVHLKTMGYSAMFLLDKDGNELGQLAPGYTKITYVDWK